MCTRRSEACGFSLVRALAVLFFEVDGASLGALLLVETSSGSLLHHEGLVR